MRETVCSAGRSEAGANERECFPLLRSHLRGSVKSFQTVREIFHLCLSCCCLPVKQNHRRNKAAARGPQHPRLSGLSVLMGRRRNRGGIH